LRFAPPPANFRRPSGARKSFAEFASSITSRRTPYAAASILWPLIPKGFYFHSRQFNWYAKWSPHGYEAQAAFMHSFHEELKNSGALVAAEGLAPPKKKKPWNERKPFPRELAC
jgi:hypothetical protein